MELLKIGARAANTRLTYGQTNPVIFAAAIAALVVGATLFDVVAPRFISAPRSALYVGGFLLGMGLFRTIMKIRWRA